MFSNKLEANVVRGKSIISGRVVFLHWFVDELCSGSTFSGEVFYEDYKSGIYGRNKDSG